MKTCGCCGQPSVIIFIDGMWKCDGCELGDCDPSCTWHCFTGHCDGSGCSYEGECEGK